MISHAASDRSPHLHRDYSNARHVRCVIVVSLGLLKKKHARYALHAPEGINLCIGCRYYRSIFPGRSHSSARHLVRRERKKQKEIEWSGLQQGTLQARVIHRPERNNYRKSITIIPIVCAPFLRIRPYSCVSRARPLENINTPFSRFTAIPDRKPRDTCEEGDDGRRAGFRGRFPSRCCSKPLLFLLLWRCVSV